MVPLRNTSLYPMGYTCFKEQIRLVLLLSLNSKLCQNELQGLLKHRWLSLTPRVSDSIGLGWSPQLAFLTSIRQWFLAREILPSRGHLAVSRKIFKTLVMFLEKFQIHRKIELKVENSHIPPSCTATFCHLNLPFPMFLFTF